ncbi:hypothetical protein J6590_002302 [Homalodisca vitripennis]|nr:hypothetical protein J6590_002302 [Homalodisca vitripennis]
MSSSTTVMASPAAVFAPSNATPTAPAPSTAPWSSMPPHAEPIFLQTKLAQGIAGAFVWVALFLTCQQVKWTLICCGFDDTSPALCGAGMSNGLVTPAIDIDSVLYHGLPSGAFPSHFPLSVLK